MKYIKIIISTIITIFLVLFLYYAVTINPSLKRSRDIRNLREATKITYKSKEIDIKYKDELIDIIERGNKTGLRNLTAPKSNIVFYNNKDEVINSLEFYEDEYDIGFQGREKTILENDRERFLKIINCED